MSEKVYVPDKWVVLEFDQKGKKWHRLLAAWDDVSKDYWRVSSTIKDVKISEGKYTITSENGTKYICSLDNVGLTTVSENVYENWVSAAEEETKGNLQIHIVDALTVKGL